MKIEFQEQNRTKNRLPARPSGKSGCRGSPFIPGGFPYRGDGRPPQGKKENESVQLFDKNKEDEKTEEQLLKQWVDSLPEEYSQELRQLYSEMELRESREAKIYKAIDSLEALIQHNFSDISTWIPKEYSLNMTYADDKVEFSDYLKELRNEIREDTILKIDEVKER